MINFRDRDSEYIQIIVGEIIDYFSQYVIVIKESIIYEIH